MLARSYRAFCMVLVATTGRMWLQKGVQNRFTSMLHGMDGFHKEQLDRTGLYGTYCDHVKVYKV